MRMDKNGRYIKDEKHKSKNKPEMIMFTTKVGPSSPMIRCDKTETTVSDFTGLYDYVKDNNLNYKVGDTVKAEGYPLNSMLTCVGSGTSGGIHTEEPDNKDTHHRNKRYYNSNNLQSDSKYLKDLIKAGAIKGEFEHPTNKPNSEVDNKPDNTSIDELNEIKDTTYTATYQKKVYEIQMKINAVFDKYARHKLDSYLIDKIFDDVCNILSSPEIHKNTAYDILRDVSKRIHDKLSNDYANIPKYYDDKIVLSYLNYFGILMNKKEYL